MIYELRRRNPQPTLLQCQGMFNLPQHIGMVWEELAFDETKLYTVAKWIAAQLSAIAVAGIRTLVPRVRYPAL